MPRCGRWLLEADGLNVGATARARTRGRMEPAGMLTPAVCDGALCCGWMVEGPRGWTRQLWYRYLDQDEEPLYWKWMGIASDGEFPI